VFFLVLSRNPDILLPQINEHLETGPKEQLWKNAKLLEQQELLEKGISQTVCASARHVLPSAFFHSGKSLIPPRAEVRNCSSGREGEQILLVQGLVRLMAFFCKLRYACGICKTATENLKLQD